MRGAAVHGASHLQTIIISSWVANWKPRRAQIDGCDDNSFEARANNTNLGRVGDARIGGRSNSRGVVLARPCRHFGNLALEQNPWNFGFDLRTRRSSLASEQPADGPCARGHRSSSPRCGGSACLACFRRAHLRAPKCAHNLDRSSTTHPTPRLRLPASAKQHRLCWHRACIYRAH